MSFFHIYLLAFFGAFVTALAALPSWRRWCLRTGLVDDPGHRKIHDTPIALAGGLTVMTALILPTILAVLILQFQVFPLGTHVHNQATVSSNAVLLDSNTAFLLTHGLKKRSIELGAILLGAFGMLIVGLVDDKRELRPKTKFLAQFLVAVLVAASGARITLFVHNVVFSYAVTILWILTVINAFNFMDNMNGLCGGLGMIGAFYFAAIAGLSGQYLVALIASLTCGALLGFLPYNFPRARSFLGDSGSHLVGYLLAVLAILPHFYTPLEPRVWSVLSPLAILAVPLADMVRVVIFRWRAGKPFYEGDNNHISHRLVQWGFSRTRAVLLIWAVAILVGALALF